MTGHPGRIDAIDALKGLAILGVLFSHAHFDRFSPDTRLLADRGAYWLQWCVPAFFFAAGVIARHPTSTTDLGRFIRSRAVRLLTPFIVFTLLYYMALAATGKPCRWCWVRGVGPQLYFLTYLFVVSGAVALFIVATKARPGWMVVFVTASIGLTALFTPTTRTSGSEPALIGLYAANYLVGVCSTAWRPDLPTVLLAAGTATASYWTSNFNLLAAGAPPFIYAALGAAPASMLLRPVQWLGRWSAAIFIWHAPIVMPGASVLAVRLLGGGTGALVMTLVTAIIGSISLGWVAERWSALRPLRI